LRAAENHILCWLPHAHQAEILRLALDGRAGAEDGYRPYLDLLEQQPKNNPAAHEQWARALLQAFESFRILCAVRDGEWGVVGLNQTIEKHLEAEGLIQRRSEWYVGRPVMVTRNDYGTGVFNGDIGIALPDALRPDTLRVFFLEGQTVRSVLATRLRSVETAYAMTIHKSQGSEFRHTVMALPRESSPVLTRELVYTGITRARLHFTLVSPVSAVFEEAIERQTKRASGLQKLLGS
jgi:exodeoxyribonuclease V alpha subunit